MAHYIIRDPTGNPNTPKYLLSYVAGTGGVLSEWTNAPQFAFPFKTLADARKIAARLDATPVKYTD